MLDPFIYKSDHLRVLFGRGTVDKLAGEVEFHKMSRVMVLCSHGRGELGQSIAARLGARAAGISNAARPGMPAAAFDEIVADLARLSADGFVCVGGGSPIGLAKAVAAQTKTRFIAVVTTYSGSEMAPRWYIGSGDSERTGQTPDALPATAIYDPDLTLDLPFATSAASCMNAMAHAVESVYSPETNPVVQAMAEEAIRLLGSAFPRLKKNPRDINARTDALYGAWLAAAFRTPVCLSHNIAQRVRRHFGTEHGPTHAAVLPYAAAFNRSAAPAAMARIARALGDGDPAQALYDINVACGLATGLNALGMREQDIPRAVEIVAKRKFPNPRPVTAADVENVIRQAFAGRPPRF